MRVSEEVDVVDWMQCPVIESVPGRRAGRPVIRRSRVRPEDLIENIEQGPEWLAENHELAIEDVRTVLAFYDTHVKRLAAAS